DTSQTIDLETEPLNGAGFLIKAHVLSIDPGIHGKMRSVTHSNSPQSKIWKARRTHGFGIGVVLRSENPDLAEGQYIYGPIPHQEYSVLKATQGLTLLEKDSKFPWNVYVGAAGLPDKTAFMGWKEFSKAKKNFTPMRQKVIQFAKRDGLKVIASAGSEVKVEFMKKIGADVAFDYKTTDTRKVLARDG
ncbi:hypothetical protein FB451DRAFT_975999, partial [Mycena latifolia]